MLKFSVKTFLILALLFVLFTIPAPKAEAMEPVSIAMLAAPIAIPIAKAMIPYVIKGGTNFFGGMADVFVDMAGIFLLPVGLIESTFLAPFGFFTDGMRNMGKGIIAPFKMTWSTVILPVRIFTG